MKFQKFLMKFFKVSKKIDSVIDFLNFVENKEKIEIDPQEIIK